MWVTASPNSTYGSSILRWSWESLFPRWNLLTFFGKVHSARLWLISSCTVCCIGSHITPFLFELNYLTFSSSHRFALEELLFGVEIYSSTFTRFDFIFRLIELEWLIIRVSVWLIGASSSFLCEDSSFLHCMSLLGLTRPILMQYKQNYEIWTPIYY